MVRRRLTCTITAAVAVGLALLPGTGVASASPPTRAGSDGDLPALVRELDAHARGHARIARDRLTERVTFVGAADARSVSRPAAVPATGTPEATARAYLRHLAPLTGVTDHAVRAPRVLSQPWGSTVRYEQTSGGLPVLGGEVTVSLDRSRGLTAYSARTTDASVDGTPSVGAAAAARTALRVPARIHHLPARALRAGTPVLSVYDSRLLGVPGAAAQALVWRTEVTAPGRPEVRELVLVDAHRGTVVLHFSEVDHADGDVPQQVCDLHEVRRDMATCTDGADVVPDPSTAGGDAQAAYDNTAATVAFYRDVLGRNGIDDAGMPIVSTVNYCPTFGACPYDNASWDGVQMTYGSGLPAALDVVGHELTHGVTEHTSNLMYYFQSGAINESMSDVMGELLEQLTHAPAEGAATNWLIGQDVPQDSRRLHDLRSMQDPTFATFTPTSPGEAHGAPQPDRMTSSLWEPGTGVHGIVDAGGVHENSGVGNKAAYLIAEGTHLEATGAFNGRAFTGMTDDTGHDLTDPAADRSQVLAKVASLYYSLQQMMTSSATYADLYHLLPQACSALVSVGTVRGRRFNPADCSAVQHAVDATELGKNPVVPGANPKPMAPLCTNGGTPTVTWSDDFEDPTSSAAKWLLTSTSPAAGERAWFTNPPDYGRYPNAGRGNLWGDDPAGDEVAPVTLTAQMLNQPSAHAFVPATGTYLWFAHTYGFDEFDFDGSHYFGDGGRVEYTTDPTSTPDARARWVDAGPLLDVNGYTGTVAPTDNPLAGRGAFVGSSAGHTASRLNLSSLAGKPVRVRWVIGAASDSWGSYGWFVDDVRLYSCNPTALSVSRATTIAYGHTTTVAGALTVAGTTRWINGRQVLLYQRPHGSGAWSYVASRTTSYHGSYSFTGLKPLRHEDYQVRFYDSAPWAHSTATTTVYVAPVVSARSTTTSFRLGGGVTLYGGVSPRHGGQYVYLQRYVGNGAWRTVASQRLSSTSTYSMRWKPTWRAGYVLRVLKTSDADHSAAASAHVTIHVG